ncbi:hypothetical protein BDQ17DRAFT_369303 [Cyathus striatus]|nr:hypothetical protein BDQ17DRAFT_369303 [Cyathus striatus]
MLHLCSIIYIPAKVDHRGPNKFHHASVKDFLLDPARSGEFFIDFVKGNIFLAQRCHIIILHMPFQDSPVKSAFGRYSMPDYACCNYFCHMRYSKFDIQLLNEFRQLEDMQLFMSYMFSNLKDYEIMFALEDVFDFDFSKDVSRMHFLMIYIKLSLLHAIELRCAKSNDGRRC